MRLPITMPFLLVAAFGTLAGCGGTDPEPSGPPPQEELLAAPPAGQGVQFKMTTELEPGAEVEHCLFVKGPVEGMAVNHDEVRYSAGSHHVLVYETTYTDIPTAMNDGTKVDTSGVFDCSNGATNGWSVTKLVSGSQNADGTSMLSLPPGVAMKVKPNAVLLMNAHYINATAEKITPEVRVNMYTIPESDVKAEGDILFLYNPFIFIGANGEGRAQMRCPVHKDITIQNIQSHMHARGMGYEASLLGDATPLYTNTKWADVPVKDFGAGLVVKAGSTLDYFCEYKNSEAREIHQGPRSTDEMCMLIGSYWPADPYTSNCVVDTSLPIGKTVNGGDWVGNGKATCAETFSCVQAALKTGFNDMMPCVTSSDPAVSKEMSSALRCLFNSFINGTDPTMKCQTEFSTCLAK